MRPCLTSFLILAITAAGAQPGWGQDVFSEALGPRTTYGVTAVAVDPRNPEVLFAGSDVDGLFTSRDGGASWQAVEMPGLVTSIEIDPGNPDIVYAAADGIFRSTDGGHTWNWEDEAPRGPNVEFLQVNPHLPGVVYVGLSSTIHRSTDSGETWRKILQGARMRMISVDARDAGTLYAAGEGLLKSTDGGDSWVPIEDGIPFEEVREEHEWGELRVTALAADPHESGVLTAGVTELPGGNPGRIYRSTDGGASWRMISEVGDRLTAMLVDPVHPEMILVGSGEFGTVQGTFLSTNGGLSWDQIDDDGAYQIVASPAGAGTYFAAMRSGGLLRGVVRIVVSGPTAVESAGWGSLKALIAPPSPSR